MKNKMQVYTLEEFKKVFPDDVDNFMDWCGDWEEDWVVMDDEVFMDDLIYKDNYIAHNYDKDYIIFNN